MERSKLKVDGKEDMNNNAIEYGGSNNQTMTTSSGGLSIIMFSGLDSDEE